MISSGNDCDLAIIGAGSAAFAAAIRSAELGAEVVVVERGTVGGTCVSRRGDRGRHGSPGRARTRGRFGLATTSRRWRR